VSPPPAPSPPSLNAQAAQSPAAPATEPQSSSAANVAAHNKSAAHKAHAPAGGHAEAIATAPRPAAPVAAHAAAHAAPSAPGAAAAATPALAGPRTFAAAFADGEALFKSGNTEAALAKYEEAARLNASDARTQRQIGKCYNRLGQRDRALPYFKRYLELAPDASDAEFIRAMVDGK
jgi:tetratricopeptide (TPR) repeat protein